MSAQYNETRVKTFTGGAVMGNYLRVKAAAGVVTLAGVGATDIDIGVLNRPALAIGDQVPVTLRNAQGTTLMVAAAAIAADVEFYGAAGGKISTTVSGPPLGKTLEAATADNDVIEVIRY